MQIFKCKQFEIQQSEAVFKITTDATLLGALAAKGREEENLRILEIGCGTGIISLMMAQRFPNAQILAIDIDEKATEICGLNFERSPFSNRLQVLRNDFLHFKSEENNFDLIVSNPPYFVNDTPSLSAIQKNARHQHKLNYRTLIEKSSSLLRENGTLSIISPYRYQEQIDAYISLSCGINRILFAHNENSAIRNMITEITKSSKGNESVISENRFHLKKTNGEYSQSYIETLKDFLTIF